ncbi:MAG: hypothetical protein LBI10_11795, partial [Deltaproteobacteria bacterium]|nr:hypothetical protein [Deltaproteobacteria bacterium]
MWEFKVMAMDLTGVDSHNEYYSKHYFATIFEENAAETIANWRLKATEFKGQTPWAKFRDCAKLFLQGYGLVESFLTTPEQKLEFVQNLANHYLTSLGYPVNKPQYLEVTKTLFVPVFREYLKANGAPLLWVILSDDASFETEV